MSKSKLVLALVTGLALPLGAIAAEPTDKPAGKPAAGTPGGGAEGRAASPMFQQLDANRDGHVTMQEAEKSAEAKASFKDLDKNGDGRISAQEWKEGGGQ